MERKTFKTTCARDCFGGCTMDAHVEDGRIVKVEGGKGNDATHGVLCAKGMHYREYVYSPDRIKYPLLRVGKRGEGKFKRISWEFAADKICNMLNEVKEESGPLGLMYYAGGGGQGMMSEYYKGFFSQFGGYTAKKGNLCCSAGVEAANLTYGEPRQNAPWDIENAGLIILWGKNSAHTNVHEMKYLNNVISKGGKIVTIDPIRTLTSLKSHLHIAPNPGTDTALALCIMNLLIERESIDAGFVQNYTNGFEALKSHVAGYTLKEASRICGVSEEQIISLVELIERNKPMTVVCGAGIQRYKNGGQTVRAISMIPALTGDIGIEGGGFRFFGEQWSELTWPFIPQDKWEVRNDYPASLLGKAIEGYSNPKISMLWVERANPLVMHPDINGLKKALEKLEHMVVVEQFMTDTAKYADIVLPAKSFCEYNDIFTSYWAPYISCFQQVIEPYYESKNEAEIYRMLGERMGYDMSYLPEYNDDVINSILKNAGINTDMDSLKEGPYMESGMDVAFADRKFKTPSGKVELYSEAIVEKWGESPIPAIHDIVMKHDKYPLRFLSTHPRERIHSQFAGIKGLSSDKALLYISSEDARKRDIKNSDMVEVFNDKGRIHAFAHITDDIKIGVTNVFEGLSGHTGASVNVLTEQDNSDIGWGATYYDCFVEVRKVTNFN